MHKFEVSIMFTFSVRHFETCQRLDIVVDLLQCFNSKNVTVNYDIGNSASLGFDPEKELRA